MSFSRPLPNSELPNKGWWEGDHKQSSSIQRDAHICANSQKEPAANKHPVTGVVCGVLEEQATTAPICS